jgi:site-specific DNA recombinase
LPRPSVTDRHHPVFHDARLEPFLDQADDAPVADPMLQEADQPFLVDLIERLLDRLPTTALIISTTIPIR